MSEGADLTFGSWLKQRRRSLGLTREALARRVNYSPVAIKKVEADERRPSETMSLMLAKALDVPSERVDAFVKFARSGQYDPTLLSDLAHKGSGSSQPAPSHKPHTVSLPPVPLTPLIGRQQELVETVELLKHTGTRLVSFIGPPGVGKTRLALEVALACMPSGDPSDPFVDGVAFVPLAPLHHRKQVVPAICSSLNVQLPPAHQDQHNSNDIPSELASQIRSRRLLLVLDNFEHVLGAAPLVADLLKSAPNLKVLITSREPLRIYGERRFEVQPLAYPPAGYAGASPEALREFPAVELFEQRAMAIAPAFRLSEDNVRDVVQICRMLDGLPLAIEMAASQVSMTPVRKLRAQLSAHLDQLEYGQRDSAQRFDGLRETIAWSYNQLSPEHQLVFKALSVFADWADVSAIAAVLADLPAALSQSAPSDAGQAQLSMGDAPAALGTSNTFRVGGALLTTLLQTLVEKGLALRQFTPDDDVKFGMLRVLREFGLDELRASGEYDLFMERHARHMLEIAERFGQAASPAEPPYVERMRLMDHYRADIHAALEWATFARQDIPLAARLAKAMANHWISRGLWSEARYWLYSILRQVDTSPSISTSAERIAILTELSYELAFVSTQPDVLDEIERLLNQQLALVGANGTDNDAWDLLHSLLLIYTRRGQHDKGRALHERLLELARQNNQPAQMVQSLALVGISCWLGGQLDRGIDFCSRALEMAKQLHFVGGMSMCLENIARAVQLKGDLARAIALFDEALSCAEQANSAYAMAYAIDGIACIAGVRGFAQAFAELQGVVESICTTYGVVLEPQFRVGYDQAMAHSQGVLGRERFETLKARAGKMPQEQSLAFAHRIARRMTAGEPISPAEFALTRQD